MIKPMVVDLEVDATLGDGFYYFFYSQKELAFTKFYLQLFFEKKLEIGVGFENTWTVSGNWNAFSVIPIVYQ